MNKRIQYSRHTHDYDAYLDEEYVGAFDCYHTAEVELDRLALERIVCERVMVRLARRDPPEGPPTIDTEPGDPLPPLG